MAKARNGYNGVIRDGETQTNTGATKMMTQRTNKTAKQTNKTAKQTNIEGKFFGMIVLAWALLAIVFNLAHSFIPQAKAPAAPKAVHAAASASVTRVASL